MKHRCPICKSPTDSEIHPDFPFCGERCRLRDLGAWASEKYVVSDPMFDEEEFTQAEGQARAEVRKRQDEIIH